MVRSCNLVVDVTKAPSCSGPMTLMMMMLAATVMVAVAAAMLVTRLFGFVMKMMTNVAVVADVAALEVISFD